LRVRTAGDLILTVVGRRFKTFFFSHCERGEGEGKALGRRKEPVHRNEGVWEEGGPGSKALATREGRGIRLRLGKTLDPGRRRRGGRLRREARQWCKAAGARNYGEQKFS